MRRKSTKSIPTPPVPAAPKLVWDGEPALALETVTVRRKVIRDTGRGGHITLDMAISLPRVRFLEMADDPTVQEYDALGAESWAEGEMPLAA